MCHERLHSAIKQPTMSGNLRNLLVLILTCLSHWSLIGLSAIAISAQELPIRPKQTTNNTQKRKASQLSSSPFQTAFELDNSSRRYDISNYWHSARTSILLQVYNIIHPLQQQYAVASPKVKFTAGTLVGFVSTKVVLGTAFKMIKLVGAAYLM